MNDGNLGSRRTLRGIRTGMRLRSLLGVGLGLAVVWGIAGCHKTSAQNSGATIDQNAGDPANANFAPVNASSGNAPAQPSQVMGQNAQNYPQQQGEDYSQQAPAPIERRQADGSYAPADNGAYANDDAADQQAQDIYDSDLTAEQASEPPPPLPDYDQPAAPDPDYLWTPGYWAWGPGGYYWVPGAWVEAPYEGALWTPGYWGFMGGYYRFHHGFWGLHIGFYGGVDYGYGYVGHGYYGGYWNRGHFFYNTAVNRVNTNAIHNVYAHNVMRDNKVVNGRITDRVSYNGGRGGVNARPMAAEIAVMHEQRHAPMAVQVQLRDRAAQNKAQFFNQNKGRPAVAADARPMASGHQMPAELPRAAAAPQGRTFQQNGAQPQGRPGAVQSEQRGPQNQAQPQGRALPGVQRQNRPEQAQPQNRPEPQIRQSQPQPQNRPEQQVQPGQSHPQPQNQAEPRGRVLPGGQPQNRPEPQSRQAQPQQNRPEPQVRQAPQPQNRSEQQNRPEPQARQARPQSQVRQAPQPQSARPAPQVRQAPPQREAPAARPQQQHPEERHPQS
jgi:hypothetical protein